MISKPLEEMMLEKKELLLIKADNVANLMINNPLNHALLVLSKVRFSKIPVLGKNDRFVGTVGLSEVVDKIIETQSQGDLSLEDFTVGDVVDIKQPTLLPNWSLEEATKLLIDYNFVPVVDDDKCFKGIITRKAFMSAVSYTFHEFDKKNATIPRGGNILV